MRLLDRDELLADVRAHAAAAASGSGRVLVVAGEAGAGKTSLVRAALDGAVWGYCEALTTPRPLGPFRDIAGQLWPTRPVRVDAVRLGGRLLRHLESTRQPVVVEDAHWIDSASADLLRHVGRRIGATSGLLVVIAREERPGSAVLDAALGDLVAGDTVQRLTVPPLSRAAVTELLAGTAMDIDEALGLTSGNAFLISQLAEAGIGRPTTRIGESVAARVARLTPAARDLVERLSVLPGRTDLGIVDPQWRELDEATEAGLVRSDGTSVEFRHELVRLAVEEQLSEARRHDVHSEAVRRIADLGADPARLAHHARAARDVRAALGYERVAAEQADRLGSYREAVAHNTRALADAEHMGGAAEHAEILVALARQLHAIAHDTAAADAARRAATLASRAGEPALQSSAMRTLSRLTRDEAEARELALGAVRLAAAAGLPGETAAAQADFATNRMLARDLSEAITAARSAIEAAESSGDIPTVVVAADALGSALLLRGETDGEAWLRRAVHLGAANGLDREVARAYANLVSAAGEARLYALSHAVYREALRYFVARDLDGMAGYTRAWHARCCFEQGMWDEASTEVDAVLAEDRPQLGNTLLLAHCIRARINVRRGIDGVDADLAAAQDLADATGSLQRIAPVAAARAEAAWITRAAPPDTLGAAYELARERNDPWTVGELGFWLWRHGRLTRLAETAAEPYRLHVGGDPEAAGAAWLSLGCAYEAAEAWSDSEDIELLRRALRTFQELRAAPAAARVSHRLRELGVQVVARGPRASTAAHPDGLTAREADVLQLLRAAHTDSEIADRLHLSVKTVQHHVSAILRKTGVGGRRALVDRSRLGRDESSLGRSGP